MLMHPLAPPTARSPVAPPHLPPATAGLVRYRDAFWWQRSVGGQAFEYTILSLRRRHLAMKALYYA